VIVAKLHFGRAAERLPHDSTTAQLTGYQRSRIGRVFVPSRKRRIQLTDAERSFSEESRQLLQSEQAMEKARQAGRRNRTTINQDFQDNLAYFKVLQTGGSPSRTQLK